MIDNDAPEDIHGQAVVTMYYVVSCVHDLPHVRYLYAGICF